MVERAICERDDFVEVAGNKYLFSRPKFLHAFPAETDFIGLLVSVEDDTAGRGFVFFDMDFVLAVMKGRSVGGDEIVAFARDNEEVFDRLVNDTRHLTREVEHVSRTYGKVAIFRLDSSDYPVKTL